MARSLLVALAFVGCLALTATSANACMRDRTPDKLVLIDKTLETKALSAVEIAQVRDLRTKASTLSVARKYREAENAADAALRILAVTWEEPKPAGPPTRC